MHPSKRRKVDSIDVLTDFDDCSDDLWFEAIFHVMKTSDFIDGLLKDKILACMNTATRKRKPYESHARSTNLWTSVWGRMMKHDLINVEGSWCNRKFRRRFRVPYGMFLEIVQECKHVKNNCSCDFDVIIYLDCIILQYNVFGIEVRKSKIPVEFKVLSCLKILGI